MVDKATVGIWLKEVKEKIRLRNAEIERLREELAAETRREAALRVLLTESGAGAAEAQLKAAKSPNAGEAERSGAALHPIERGAVEILRERGNPTHVTELRAELIRRGIPIPGKGTDANVIVHLARSREVGRVGRGLYALRAWNIPEVPPRRRRKRRPRRKGKA